MPVQQWTHRIPVNCDPPAPALMQLSFAPLPTFNLAVADKLELHEPVTAAGLPLGFPEPQRLVPADCLRSTK
jgi:hypothetical protein